MHLLIIILGMYGKHLCKIQAALLFWIIPALHNPHCFMVVCTSNVSLKCMKTSGYHIW